MKTNNVVQDKGYAFALKIINTHTLLREQYDFELGSQILKSGTSIGANVEEAIGAVSTKDFLSKISIAYKEARETHYWIRLLRDSNKIGSELAALLLADVDELLRILSAIQRKTKLKLGPLSFIFFWL
jgi:four helix bundle protein